MRLYMAHVGFYDNKIGIYEIHSNIFVVAKDIQSAKHIIKNKEIFIDKNMHIDGIEEVVSVDGYDIVVSENKSNLYQNKTFDYIEVQSLEE